MPFMQVVDKRKTIFIRTTLTSTESKNQPQGVPLQTLGFGLAFCQTPCRDIARIGRVAHPYREAMNARLEGGRRSGHRTTSMELQMASTSLYLDWFIDNSPVAQRL